MDRTSSGPPHLVIDDERGRHITPVVKSVFTLGRSAESDVQLVGSDISRHHAEIALIDDRWILRDRGSRHGTFVNDAQIVEQELHDGDRVVLGRQGAVEIVFLSDGSLIPNEITSSVAGAVFTVVRKMADAEYYEQIATLLVGNHVHCPDIDSGDFQRQLSDPDSPAVHALAAGFHRIVVLNALRGVNDHGLFKLRLFLSHIALTMSEAFELSLPTDEFHPEEVSQVLKDEPTSLFCFLNVGIIPAYELRRFRGFTQEHHRVLFCGAHSLDTVRTSTVVRHRFGVQLKDGRTIVHSRMEPMLDRFRTLGWQRGLDEVFARLLDTAIDLTNAERGTIMLADEQSRLACFTVRARGRLSLSGPIATSGKVPEQVFASGLAQSVFDVLDDSLIADHLGTAALGIRQIVCTPLCRVRFIEDGRYEGLADTRIGVLYLDSREKRDTADDTVVEKELSALAIEAALAIENARLVREGLDFPGRRDGD